MAEKKNIRSKVSGVANEFKSFAFKDNVLNLAIGVIIGTAFKDLIDSLVKNIFTPPIGFLTADIDFSNLFFTLGSGEYTTIAEAEQAGVAIIRYGLFINTLISFLITAIVVFFFVVKVSQKLQEATKKEEKKAESKTRECPYCLSEISKKATKCAYCTSSVKPLIKEE